MNTTDIRFPYEPFRSIFNRAPQEGNWTAHEEVIQVPVTFEISALSSPEVHRWTAKGTHISFKLLHIRSKQLFILYFYGINSSSTHYYHQEFNTKSEAINFACLADANRHTQYLSKIQVHLRAIAYTKSNETKYLKDKMKKFGILTSQS